MEHCARILHLTPHAVLKNLLFSSLLLFLIISPALAEDLNPPYFAGGDQTGVVFWEFSADSDQPTSYSYYPPLTSPNLGFRYYSGAWQWQSGVGLAGDGAMLLVGDESLVQPIPEGTGDFLTVYFQITWQGAGPDLGLGLEIWGDPFGWTPGEEFEEEYLGGAEWPEPIEEYDLGGGWTQSTFAAAFWSDGVEYVHIILHMDIGYDLLIDEAVVDMVRHNDFPPPTGPGRGGATPVNVEILGEWQDESSDLSRPKESGSDSTLIFTAHAEDNTGTDMNLSSVTYGGQPMTKVADYNVADADMRAYVASFILNDAGIAAASGGNFDVTWQQQPSTAPAYSSVFLSGVHQSNPIGALDTNSILLAPTVATDPLTTNAGDMVILTATAGNSSIYQVDNGFTKGVELSIYGADGVTGHKTATGANEIAQVTLPGSIRQGILGFVVQSTQPDTSAPEPDPMTWASAPQATGRHSIAMTATTASDPSGIRYYFEETSGNSGASDSGWQTDTSYSDTGLIPDTQYTYRVKARDMSVNRNETGWSTPQSAITDPPDTQAPTPDPALWASVPMAIGPFSISMMAAEAVDDFDVEYYFEETSGNEGGSDSGWQSDRLYTDQLLAPQTQYTYRVKARDMSPQQNETEWSVPESATTDKAPSVCPEVDLNKDCICNVEDLLVFAAQWLDPPGCAGHPDDCADLNGQDGVDGVDFAILYASWFRESVNLVINEIMAGNDTIIEDEYGQHEDWIEIYNPSGDTIDMSGMYLADNDDNMWLIPSGVSISPGEYKLFWADEDWPEQGNNHTNFKLSKSGDGVTLYEDDGFTPIDTKSFDGMLDDVSYGRYADAADNWYDMAEPTPGLPNKAGILSDVYFSHPGGTFTTLFDLQLSTQSPTATIYYTINGDEPTESTGQLYTGPVSVNETSWVRARAYEADFSPSPITSRVYMKLDTDVQSFQSNLPIVVIDSFGWDIDDAGRDFYPVSAVFIDTDEATGTSSITGAADWAGYGGMHIHGNSTEGYEKKQYRFETWDEKVTDPAEKSRYKDTNVSLLGFPAESDWIIHGPFSDKTLMRNYQMFSWSRQIGRYAVRCRFVEVFLDFDNETDPGNGRIEWDTGAGWSETDYRGVYVFMEKIKQDNDRVDIAKLEPSDNSEPKITGGYILKKDWGGDGFETSTYNDWLMYEDPRFEELSFNQRVWLRDYFNEFEAALAGPSFDDPCSGYANYIDVGSFVDHHILVEFAKNVDGFLLSTFLHKDRGGKINMGPIWDYNGSLGGADYTSNWDPVGWLYEVDDEVTCPDEICCVINSCWRYRLSEGGCPDGGVDDLPNHYGWYERLFEDPEFLLAYADNWFRHREKEFKTDKMLGDIDNNVALLTTNIAGVGPNNAIDRNYTRWDVLEDELWPNYYDNCNASGATYLDYVNWMKNWIDARLVWMDLEIDTSYGDAPPDIKVNGFNANRGGYISSGDSISMTSSGGTIYYTTDGTDPRLHGGAIAGSASAYSSSFMLSESKQIKARIRYTSSNWSALNEATFDIGDAISNLRITEIMYNVNDPNHEFIELKNIGGSALNLNLVKFTDGIDFTFPSLSLPAGGYCVAARNAASFALRYPGFSGTIAGEFAGAINNGGERITLADSLGETILDFRFKDGWYPITDGEDFSLNIIDPANPDPNNWEYARYWQPSSVAGGTPSDADTGHAAEPGDI
ncbi:MAG: CotH kinase family protein, partial [Planctomycetota bacterium]